MTGQEQFASSNKVETEVDEFTRLELYGLSEKARAMAAIPGLNPFWARAYWALALAADHLDAMFTRSTTPAEDEDDLSPVKETLGAGGWER